MPPLQQLALVAGIWAALHVLVAGSPLRRVIAGKIGEGPYSPLLHFHHALIGVSLPW